MKILTVRNKSILHAIIFTILIGITVTSCYKIIRTEVPLSVTGTETFEARLVVADDGSSTQNFSTDWSVAAIRVPEGWSVTVPEKCHRQYAEDWVYYSDGSKVDGGQDMEYNAHLSDIYNVGAPKKGYKWWAFVSKEMVPKHMTACWRNGCDSISVTFLVTPNGVPGKYQIDFIAGDEEDEQGVGKYSNFSEASGTRLIHASTINTFSNGKHPDNAAVSMSREVVVNEETGIQQITTPESKSQAHPSAIYDLEGRLLREGTDVENLPEGIYIINGEKVQIPNDK